MGLDAVAAQWLRVTVSEQGLKTTVDALADIAVQMSATAGGLADRSIDDNPFKKEMQEMADRFARDANRLRSCLATLESK